jgi:L-malate glycosyltransferase
MQSALADRRLIAGDVGPPKPVICQLLHTLHVGGAEVLATRLGRKLQDQCRFIYVCLDDAGTLGRDLRDEGFPVYVLERCRGVDWRCAFRLARILKQEKVDLIQAHQYTPFFYGLLARLIHRKPPLLFTEHGRHFPDYPRFKRKVANRLLLQARDRVVAVGQAVRQALINNEGIAAARIEVVYNGVEIERDGDAPANSLSVRHELGFAEDDFLILQVARLDYLKDHATAVRLMNRVTAQLPGARLLLVGDGPEQAAIQQLVQSLGLGKHVRFLGLRTDVARLLRSADLFLLTSISEGIPLTIIEAMLARLPVVATQVGGVPEIVIDGETGLLGPAGDDSTLASHVIKLADNHHVRLQMGQQGRQHATARFSERRMHEHYLKLYSEMLQS